MAKDAWFLGAEFEAKDKKILGMPVEQIDPDFKKASLLSATDMINKFPEAKKDLKDSDAVFAVDWNRGGKQHRIAVGVYVGQQDEGSFLLVAEKEKSGWKKLFLQKTPGKRRFTVLQDLKHSILFNECLECGHGVHLTWDRRSGYSLQESSEDEDSD
jgi:hypothetical protein